jgi:hypothetical protein
MMNHQESEPFEWYIFEGLATGSSPVAEPALRLGPFATERECHTMLKSIRRIPRFSRNALAVHKKCGRRGKRIKVELPVYFRRFMIDEKFRCARTVDISKSRARLAGVMEATRLGEVFEIRCGDRKAPFQVVWLGSPGTAAHGEVGVECLTPEVNIWGLDPSQQADEELPPNEVAVASAVQTRLLPQELRQLRTLDYNGHCIQARTV